MNQIKSNINLLEELKKIISYRDRNDETIVSLYDLSSLIKKKNLNYSQMMTRNFKTVLNNNCNGIKIHIHNINYDTEELILTLDYTKQYRIACKKENGSIILTPVNQIPNFIISKFNTEQISLIYDNVMQYKDYIKEEYYRIPSSNSSFLINIIPQGISIYKENNDKKEFILSSYTFKEECILHTNSNDIKEIITNNEELILKNTFIKIEKCPKWAQNKLYKDRLTQIKNNNLPKVKKIKK